MRKKLLNVCGFTLVEVLVATFIFAILCSVIALYLGHGMQAWEIGICQSDLQTQARPAMDRMINELKSARIVSVSTNEIKFELPKQDLDGKTLIYLSGVNLGQIVWDDRNPVKYWLDTEDPNNPLIRTEIELDEFDNIVSQKDKPLCTDVSDITFTKDGNELKIILSLEKTTAHGKTILFSLTSIIKLRN